MLLLEELKLQSSYYSHTLQNAPFSYFEVEYIDSWETWLKCKKYQPQAGLYI